MVVTGSVIAQQPKQSASYCHVVLQDPKKHPWVESTTSPQLCVIVLVAQRGCCGGGGVVAAERLLQQCSLGCSWQVEEGVEKSQQQQGQQQRQAPVWCHYWLVTASLQKWLTRHGAHTIYSTDAVVRCKANKQQNTEMLARARALFEIEILKYNIQVSRHLEKFLLWLLHISKISSWDLTFNRTRKIQFVIEKNHKDDLWYPSPLHMSNDWDVCDSVNCVIACVCVFFLSWCMAR